MKNKFQKSILLIYIITFVVSVIGATYAYFTTIKVNATNATLPEIEAKAAITEVISFSIDGTLDVNGSQYNMNKGMDNLVSTTNATAYMRFDGGTRMVSHLYDMVLVIDDNDFEYTTDDEKAEVVLSVKDPDGNYITSVSGLDYLSDKSVFDITTAKGEYYLAKEYTLATDSEVTQTWEVTITLVNLDTDQQVNADKILNAHVVLRRSENDIK